MRFAFIQDFFELLASLILFSSLYIFFFFLSKDILLHPRNNVKGEIKVSRKYMIIYHGFTPEFPIPQLNYKMSLLCLDDSQEKKYRLGEYSKIN